jgi:hypothetical protein
VDISGVKCSDIPDNAIALTTDLGTGKLLLQFFGKEMVFVLELHSSWSEMRDCTLPLGRDQSAGSIGSHTTRTRSRGDGRDRWQ